MASGCAYDAQGRALEEGGWSWQQPQARVLPQGDLQWAPRRFQFVADSPIRYIDFENGDDANRGITKDAPWKHHPWDANATGKAAECEGVCTYVFKRGTVYRGRLVADESGQPGRPIRLTSDPMWGQGEAAIYGSHRIAHGWRRCTAQDAPTRMPEPEDVWFLDIGTDFAPQSLYMLDGDEATRIPMAREPDWEITNWSDPMSNWWTFTGRDPETKMGIDDVHLTQRDPYFFDGGYIWKEYRGNMGTLAVAEITEFDPAKHSIKGGTVENCRYFIENVAAFLDSPGEFFYARSGRHAGRLYVRLPGDVSPNGKVIEASRIFIPIEIVNQSHIAITGLRFSFDDAGEAFHELQYPNHKNYGTSIRLGGDCQDIVIANNRFLHVGAAVIGFTRFDDEGNEQYFPPEEFIPAWREPTDGDRMEGIVVADNDIAYSDHRAISFDETKQATLRDVNILRNRLYHIGSRPGAVGWESIPAICVGTVETCEIAGNIIDRCWGCGIVTFGGKGQNDRREKPMNRILIHHNKATYTLLASNDWGGIAPWQGGVNYVYNNVSGNAVGPKHSSTDSLDWACNAYTYYLDGTYKSYVFNNIAWGLTGDVNEWPRNRAGCMQVLSFMNHWFNNTVYRFMYGFSGSSGQRCSYLGNVFDGITQRYFTQNAKGDISMRGGGQRADSVIGMIATLRYASNVFHGKPVSFGGVGAARGDTLQEFREGLEQAGTAHNQVGWIVEESPLADPANYDFRPRKDSGAIDRGVKFFVPWGLYATVGEWNFCEDRQRPEFVVGENFYMTDEYIERHMYYQIPRNDLHAPGATVADYVAGPLEDWCQGAMHFDGRDRYCVLKHADLKSDYTVHLRGGDDAGVKIPGATRRTVDMDSNSFLVEVYFRTEPGCAGGTLVAKESQAGGYALAVNDDGGLTLSLAADRETTSLKSKTAVNDGEWHHVLAEVDRAAERMTFYVDGGQTATGRVRLRPGASLANTGDFLVGKCADGDFFAGDVDFLRVCRGTLKDAETTIEELCEWQFNGPFLRDFRSVEPVGGKRDAGALEWSWR
jgi:hypothetical protein